MASATDPTQHAPPTVAELQTQQLVNSEIERTRRALKVVDLTAGLITLVIGVLAFVFVVGLLEHWLIPGGWSSGARIVLFSSLLLGMAYYSWRTFWPLLRQPINPAYAAQAIEQSSPSLKNSLLNLLLLRTRKRQLSRQVYQAIEQQAAQRLAEVPVDTAVDRGVILRLGYVLLAVVAVCSLYSILSPKNLFDSAARILLPWADVTAPSRVQILDIQPGNTAAARGDQVTITAEVIGLAEDEQARVYFSTEDQQIVRQEVFMTPQADGLRFECRLPGRMAQADGGLQQNLTYWIEAGDARSGRYQVTVFSRPTLVVQRIKYDYPDYTGYPDREEVHTGDLSAIEGTVVTLTAIANQPISSAHIDFEADGRVDNLMKAEDLQATASFPLQLKEDRRTPQHRSYVLRYSTVEGRKNELPPKYKIDVTPDYAPEIQLLLPEEETLDVAVDEQVTIEVEARDPDFVVRSVSLLGEVNEQQVLKEILLRKSHTGRFAKQYQTSPEKLGLKVGDVLEYWALAEDNRRPEANRAETKRRKIRVVGPGEGKGQQGNNPSEKNGEGEEEPNVDSPEGGQGEDGKGQEGGGNSDSDDEPGEQGEGQEGEAGEGGVGQDGENMDGENAQQQDQGDGNGQGGKGQEGGDENSQGGGEGESGEEQNNENTSQDQSGDSSGGSQPSEQSNNQERVSPDGDDDGEAFERLKKHFEEQKGKQDPSGEGGEQEQGEGESVAKQQPAEPGQGGADGKADSDQSGDANPEEAQEGSPEGAEGTQQDKKSKGQGAEGENTANQEEESGDKGEGSDKGQDKEGELSKEQGDSGAGDNPGEGETSPEPGGPNKPVDKQEEESGGKHDSNEPSSGGDNKKESDTDGGQSGDQSGGGQEGAGQQADKEGTGGAGENQAADDGGGQSMEPGEGETSSNPGDKQSADGQEGESASKQAGEGGNEGEGGKQSDEPGGKQGQPPEGSQKNDAGDKNSENPQEGEMPSDGGTQADDQQPTQQPSGQSSDSNAHGEHTPGGGTEGDANSPSTGEIEPGDQANLDYTNKQTDLILDKLDEQMRKKQVDEQLLEKLGWSQDELRRFVDRWRGLKSEAEGEAEAGDAQQELNDALRSLGLGRNRRTGFKAKTAKDPLRDLQDAPRVRTPLEYQKRLRGYIKGTATADDEEK